MKCLIYFWVIDKSYIAFCLMNKLLVFNIIIFIDYSILQLLFEDIILLNLVVIKFPNLLNLNPKVFKNCAPNRARVNAPWRLLPELVVH